LGTILLAPSLPNFPSTKSWIISTINSDFIGVNEIKNN